MNGVWGLTGKITSQDLLLIDTYRGSEKRKRETESLLLVLSSTSETLLSCFLSHA